MAPRPAREPLESFDRREESGLGGDLAGMIAFATSSARQRVSSRGNPRARSPGGGFLPHETIDVKPRPIVTAGVAGSWLPRAVMVRDSFALALIPLLSEHFSRIVYAGEVKNHSRRT